MAVPSGIDVDEYNRARLEYLSAGRADLGSRPRRLRSDGAGDGSPAARPDQPQESWLVDESLLDDLGEADEASGRGAVALSVGGQQVAEAVQRARTFGRAHARALAALVLLFVLATVTFMLRARASEIPVEQIALANTVASASASGAAGGARPAVASAGGPSVAVSAVASAATLRVHVLDGVRKPGVVTLPNGARVADAIAACGGLASGAVPGELNLAAPLVDGDQVVVGSSHRQASEVRHAQASTAGAAGPAVAGGTSGGAAAGTGGGALLNLNTATAEQLDQLPGVGPVTAQHILDWRTQHGRFSKVAELQEVDGIGPKTFAQLSSHVTV